MFVVLAFALPIILGIWFGSFWVGFAIFLSMVATRYVRKDANDNDIKNHIRISRYSGPYKRHPNF